MSDTYNIVVRSDTNYDNLIAEVTFPTKLVGFILSQEISTNKFEISVFSLFDKSKEKFYDTEKVDNLPIELSIFLEAVDAAQNRLQLLDVPNSPVHRKPK
jgi:hypothetical protein